MTYILTHTCGLSGVWKQLYCLRANIPMSAERRPGRIQRGLNKDAGTKPFFEILTSNHGLEIS